MADGSKPWTSEDGTPPWQKPEFPDPEDFPIKPLGRSKLTYYFFSSSGEVIDLGHRELVSQSAIDGLLDGHANILERYSAFEGNRKGSVEYKAVARWLMRECAAEGMWDASTPIRGPGTWRCRDGNLICHFGDTLRIDGKCEPAGKKIDGILYPAAPKLTPPADVPATAEDGEKLLKIARQWEYESDLGPDLVIGMVGASMLGAATLHRPHMLIIGKFGSGKSWLVDFAGAALGDGAQRIANDVTAASLYQTFSNQARAMVLDETEDSRNGQVERVIELLRRMSTGEGAQVRRGSPEGRSRSYSVNGTAILASTLPPVLKPQDRSRITVVHLRELAADQESRIRAAQVQEATAWAARMSPAFRARALQSWARFCDTFEVYASRFSALGMQPRDCNQAGVLLAGRDLLIADDVPQGDALDEIMDRFAPMAFWAAENQSEGEGPQALNRLLSWPFELDGMTRETHTVGAALWHAMHERGDGKRFRDALPKHGMRLEGGRDGQPWELWIANRFEFLRRVYAGSNWQDRWTPALRELEGARKLPRERYAGLQEVGTAIPECYLPTKDDPAFAAFSVANE